jgi:ankyrin repeat protein
MNERKSVKAPKTRLLLGTALITSLSLSVTAWSLTDSHHRDQVKQVRKSTEPPIAGHGKLGQDLFLAIDHRNINEVKSLLKNGADPNSRNGLEFTPLYIASASYQMDVMGELLRAGADADAESNYGTPLMFAAATGHTFGADILFSKNVNVNASRNDGMTVLMMASYSGNPKFVSELIERKADVNVKDDSGANALMYAAQTGSDKAVEVLLNAGVDVDNADNDKMTSLMAAAKAGKTSAVQLLLKKGANPNLKNAAGDTPLLLAARYGDNPSVINALVAGGADAKITDAKEQTAAKIASMHGYKNSAAILAKTTPIKLVRAGQMRTPKQAVTATLKLVQSSMGSFMKATACISCHQEGLGRIATGMASDHGFKLDMAVQKEQAGRVNGALNAMKPLHEGALKNPEVMKQVPLIEINEVTTSDSWILAGRAAQKETPNAAACAMTSVLARQQSPNGCWSMSLPRTPMQSSPFTFTALSIRSLIAYAPKSQLNTTSSQIKAARTWLINTPAKTSEDRAGQLLGLKWSSAGATDLRKVAASIQADQRPDGGWSQLPTLASDAYATGQALYALHEGGGMSVSDPVYQKGVRFLLRTQDSDGSWFVNKRAIPANNYFSAGFPHGQSQYSSFNGSCWAMMALLETINAK